MEEGKKDNNFSSYFMLTQLNGLVMWQNKTFLFAKKTLVYLKKKVFGMVSSKNTLHKNYENKNSENFYWPSIQHPHPIHWAFVVTPTQNHQIKHLFNIIQILFVFKIFQDHRIKKFDNNIDLRKVDFLSPEKINERSRFVNKDILQS